MNSIKDSSLSSGANLSPFYERLLQFQLFQGMSRTELHQMSGNTRFDFRKVSAGKTVVDNDSSCSELFFLVSGSVSITSLSDDNSYRVTELLHAPWITQPESLFGMTIRYTSKVVTETDCQFIILSKDEVLRMFDDIFTFRLNMLNYLSMRVQQSSHKVWRRAPKNLIDRLARFFADHCKYPAGHKVFSILMKQLALEVNDSRLDVSTALNAMQKDGLIELHRGRIVIPSLERLFM